MNTPIGSDASGPKQDGSLLKILARKVRDWLNRFLRDGGAPETEGVKSSVRQGEMLSNVEQEAPLPLQFFFEPAGPPEEWLRMVEDGSPELLLPAEEGGTRWQGLRAQPVESASSAPLPEDSITSIPAEQLEQEPNRIDIAGTRSDEPFSQRTETDTSLRSAQEDIGLSTNESAFLRPSRRDPSLESAVRQDDGLATPHPQAPPDLASPLAANEALHPARSAKSPDGAPLNQARGSQGREGSVDETSVPLPLGSRSPAREAANKSRNGQVSNPRKVLIQSADQPAPPSPMLRTVGASPTNEPPRRIQAGSWPMSAGTQKKSETRAEGESIGVRRESSLGGNENRIASSVHADLLPPQSTELTGLTRLAAGGNAVAPPNRGVDDRNEGKGTLTHRFVETGPSGSKPWPPADADLWPELPPDPIISFESAHLVRRLEHQRALDLEQQGGH